MKSKNLKERLENEFKQQVIVTMPNVPYKIKFTSPKLVKLHGGLNEATIYNPLMVILILSHFLVFLSASFNYKEKG